MFPSVVGMKSSSSAPAKQHSWYITLKEREPGLRLICQNAGNDTPPPRLPDYNCPDPPSSPAHMDRKKSTWGSTRSKLEQEGYIYRMKLGNPAIGSKPQPGQRRPSSSATSNNVQPGSSTDLSPAKFVPTSMLDADRTAVEMRTISGLLAQLNLGRAFRGDHELDPNSAMEFCKSAFLAIN